METLGSFSAVDYCQQAFPKEISWPTTPVIVKVRLDMSVASLVAAEEMLVSIFRKPS